jgi:glycosyltransferase involved in cell wall biosynthesis
VPKPVVLLLIPSLGTGGAQVVFRQQLAFYSARFPTVGVVFNMDGATEADRRLQHIVSLGVSAGRHWPGKLLSFVARIRGLRAIKRQHGVTVSISHLEGADYVNWFSRRAEKVICWIHGSKMHDREIRGMLGVVRRRLLMPYVYSRCENIVTVSERIADELRAHLGARPGTIQTMYNGLDTGFIREQAQEPVEPGYRKLCEEGRVVITHARLARQKNLHALIAIFSMVEPRDNIKLVILGDGEELPSLTRYCEELNLKAGLFSDNNGDADVVFMGRKDNPYRYLRHASLYVLTSRWEGYPLSVCEAIVCGLPMLVSDCYTGPREILRPDLRDVLPVSQPTGAECGMLMPVPDSLEAEVLWAETLSGVIRDDGQLSKWSAAAENMGSRFNIANAEAGWLHLVT